MSTANNAFNQVKSLLSKLDRDIDQAREKRLHGDRPLTPRTPDPVPVKAPDAPDEDCAGDQSPENGLGGRSGFGRARPMRPDKASA